VTVRNMPLASANQDARPDSPPAWTRARARLAATLRNVNLGRIGSVGQIMWADLRRSWMVTARPPAIGDWWSGLRPDPLRVPAGSPLVRAAWIADSHVTGLVVGLASLALFATAACLRWLSMHPLRRWSAIAISAATVAALIVL
jgi:hypothetical protein